MKVTKKRIVTKLVSFILSVLLFFYAIPSVIYAETVDAISGVNPETETEINSEPDKQAVILPVSEEAEPVTTINTTEIKAGANELCEYT